MQDSDLVAGEIWSHKHILAILKGSRSHTQLTAKPRLSREPIRNFASFPRSRLSYKTMQHNFHAFAYFVFFLFHGVIILPLALLFPVYL